MAAKMGPIQGVQPAAKKSDIHLVMDALRREKRHAIGRAEVTEAHPLALRWLFLKLLVLQIRRVREDADILVELH